MDKRVDLVYFNAGGGHRAAATALQAVIAQQQRPWEVRAVNLFEVLDPQHGFERWLHFKPEAYYNQRLKYGLTAGLRQELRVLQRMIRAAHEPMRRSLVAHWQFSAPNLVVSLVPNFNRVMFAALGEACPGVPFVTVLTDLADFPPHFWIEPGQAQHLVCGSAHAVEQARDAGYADAQVHAVSGMILRPDFYAPPPPDRAAQRRALGLDAETPVGVVLFGGHGSTQMQRIARAVPDTPLLLMCGHNEPLAQRLRAQPAAAPRAVVGFTTEVARHLRLGDFFIGKPGPGSLSEAVQCGLPLITVANRWTMPQERYNAHWVREGGLGVVIDRWSRLPDALAELRADWAGFKARVAAVHNRAVFEVPAILADLLRGSAPSLRE